MTKAELIRKMAKNVGVPDTDAKIFFELFLKRISAIVETGQSIFVKDFGFFHLIKGSIKKPVFSFKNNEVSEEEVELVLFSEDKDLRKSETKGLVFNIPIFDEDDYHPIDSTFSLSIGKPLIPLRGVPFENIYIPTSGYEYRRLIESKVEKVISSSDIAESVENFPTLVIDARSYNSNQVQLRWNEITNTGNENIIESETSTDVETEISEYEKQSKELKNIAWDFGEDLSQQIEADSILDIADERLSKDLIEKKSETIYSENINSDVKEDIFEEEREVKDYLINDSNEIQVLKNDIEVENIVQIEEIDTSSDKLDELLEEKIIESAVSKDEILLEDDIEIVDTKSLQINDENNLYDEKEIVNPIHNELEAVKDEDTDSEFWESTSKYFETYKPIQDSFDKNIEQEETEARSFENQTINETDEKTDSDTENDQINITENVEEISKEINNTSFEPISNEVMEENNSIDKQENFELAEEQKAEYFEPNKRRNLVPFILFPLLVVALSISLYWYLEYYKKSDIIVKPKEIVLKSDNVKIIKRDFGIPISYPYPLKVNETTVSESNEPKKEEPVVTLENSDDNKNNQLNSETKKSEQIKLNENTVDKVVPNKVETQQKVNTKTQIPTGKALNVGDNVFKYGNYYVVQVASFRSLSISENEAGKYRNKGFNAFVETAEIPDRGTWYRVRVGNFSSKEEALNFIKKNIR